MPSVTGTSYVRHYGFDWPAGTHRVFAALTIAKKWRLFKERYGVVFDSPGDRLEEALAELIPQNLKMSPWTVQMLHDFVEEDQYAMIGGGSSGKSHAMAACACAYWVVDPFDTAVIIGSATLKDLSTRAWSPMLTIFSEMKNNRLGLAVPGKLVSNQYAVVNERDDTINSSVAARSAIQGRALDEGRIVGTHVPWVCLVVDELGLVADIEALKLTITNIRIGTLGFKFVSAANPKSWDHPNSCFYTPEEGLRVDENTGSWRSSLGYFVRHFNGLRSPVVLNPGLKSEYPFLMSRDDIEQTRKLCGGDDRHPRFMQMVVGFPVTNAVTAPVVLDPAVAKANDVTGEIPPPFSGGRRFVGLAAGVDPAFTEGGDDAVNAGVMVVEQDGKVFLDFSGRVKRIPIVANSPIPVTQQLRDAVIKRMHEDKGPSIQNMYVDSSGNQSLADVIDIYVGGGCGHVNNSSRASDAPIRAHDLQRANERVKDRGTEAWSVLSAFCAAGMVKGLPPEAVRALTSRQFMTKPGTDDMMHPLRLESKDSFVSRFKGSPNEADACSLAALAVKERLGILPYGTLPVPDEKSLFPNGVQSGEAAVTNDEFDDDSYFSPVSPSDGYGVLD